MVWYESPPFAALECPQGPTRRDTAGDFPIRPTNPLASGHEQQCADEVLRPALEDYLLDAIALAADGAGNLRPPAGSARAARPGLPGTSLATASDRLRSSRELYDLRSPCAIAGRPPSACRSQYCFIMVPGLSPGIFAAGRSGSAPAQGLRRPGTSPVSPSRIAVPLMETPPPEWDNCARAVGNDVDRQYNAVGCVKKPFGPEICRVGRAARSPTGSG